jgi:hypothetical protein
MHLSHLWGLGREEKKADGSCKLFIHFKNKLLLRNDNIAFTRNRLFYEENDNKIIIMLNLI